MSIKLDFTTRKVARVIRPISGFPQTSKQLVIWAHCSIKKNKIAKSQPKVVIATREVLDTGEYSDEVYHYKVPLTSLGQLRVGTIWTEGIAKREILFPLQTFLVDFTQMKWNITSFKESKTQPFPLTLFPLHYGLNDKNQYIEFPLKTGGNLVVPCIELFTRCFGRSAELRRVLCSYSWKECIETRLYAPLEEAEEQGKWKVKLRKRLVNADVILLAHAKYDEYAEKVMKRINSQLLVDSGPNGENPVFLKAAPWFQGLARIKVRGLPFNDNKSFLALQIEGCSDPGGEDIYRSRENANNPEEPADKNDNQGQAWARALEQMLIKPPEIIDLTGDTEPDPDALPIEIEDPGFEVLGIPRLVIDVRPKKAKGTAGPRGSGSQATSYANGETLGHGGRVGYAAISTPDTMKEYRGSRRPEPARSTTPPA